MSRNPAHGRVNATVSAAPKGSRRAAVIARAAGVIEAAFTETGGLTVPRIKTMLDIVFSAQENPWEASDAHEACEIAMTRFLLRHGRAISPGDQNAAKTDQKIRMIAEREPRIRGRSRRHDILQHYATPLEVAWAMAVAADIYPGHTVLDPSAGTGLLTAMAHVSQPEAVLRAIEGDALRAELLMLAVPGVTTVCGNAILPDPAKRGWSKEHDVVLLNPPFSVRIGTKGRRLHEDLVHLLAARNATVPYGRIVALLGGGTTPGDERWEKTINGALRIIWSAQLDAPLMRNRESKVSTRLCILENSKEDYAYDVATSERYDDGRSLVAAVRAAASREP